MTDKNNSMFDESDFESDFDVYEGFDDVDTFTNIPFLEDGHKYVVKGTSLIRVVGKTTGIPYYILEFDILESTCDVLPKGTHAKRSIPLRPGKTGQFYFQKELKNIAVASLQISEEDKENIVFEKFMKDFVLDKMVVDKVFVIETKKNDKGYTDHYYSPYRG